MAKRSSSPAGLESVVAQSFLNGLPVAEKREILAQGRAVTIRAGVAVEGGRSHVGLVLEGLVRVFIEHEGGRQVTLYYGRPGDTLGLCNLCGKYLDLRAQTLASTVLYSLPRDYLRKLAQTSAPLALAVAQEAALRLGDALEEVALVTFKSVRQRIARHLLDLACAQGDALIATVTQQELADATGSVRAVVARELKALERTGWIGRVPLGLEIRDAAALDAEAHRR